MLTGGNGEVSFADISNVALTLIMHGMKFQQFKEFSQVSFILAQLMDKTEGGDEIFTKLKNNIEDLLKKVKG